MYKLVAFTALLAVAAAAPGLIGAPGYLGAPGYGGYGGYGGYYGSSIVSSPLASPIASPWGHGLVGAPVVKTAVPVATSYANTVRLASPAVVTAAHAPVYASPLAHAW